MPFFISLLKDGPGGIGSVSVDSNPASATMYNVFGQPVNPSYKGIVIQNGQKYISR